MPVVTTSALRGRLVRALGAAILASTALAALAVSPAAARPPGPQSPNQPQTVTCGMTVRQSIVLQQDLTCPGDGLIVAAPGITIDLNGRTITGTPTNYPGYWVGIRSLAGYDQVTVKNGIVSKFAGGVLVEGSKATVQGMTVRGMTLGGIAMGGREGLIVDNFVESPGNFTVGAGIIVRGHATQVRSNVVSGKSLAGIWAYSDSTQSYIADNRVRHAKHGIHVMASSTVENNAVESTTAIGIYFQGPHTEQGTGVAYPGAVGTLTGNTSSRNAGSGIVVETPPTRIASNTARSNGGYGILGRQGQVDGGGNRASGNAYNPQCGWVTCTA